MDQMEADAELRLFVRNGTTGRLAFNINAIMTLGLRADPGSS
jgi:hypothetical protein